MNYIECINVDFKSTRKESFYDLQLDVKGCRDVYASFDKYAEVERLEGDNKYHAEVHGLQDAKKGVLFNDFPHVLQLRLKRFEYDFTSDTMVNLDLDRENGKYVSPDVDISVTLSKTKKKGREHKENNVNTIREAVEQHNSIYVFSFENMRNIKFKQFREQLKSTSRAPQIYFRKGTVKYLESEVTRASKLKCTSYGKKGAVLGCYVKSCQRTNHVPRAYDIPDCRWDSLSKYLCTRAGFGNLVLCGSALSAEQKFMMVDFARTNEALVSKYWKDNVTHVIAATDANDACTRTLKMGLKACVDVGRVVNEEPYEVRLDTHGCSGGPTAGRLRALSNAPKLFNNMKFYFVGDFVQAFKSDLLNLVKTAGGTLSETKDQLLSSDHGGMELDQATYAVYNADLSICADVENEDSIKA
ncbi:putative ubiquitinyl hydrolase 1 [Helianthus anomalus]